MCGFLNDIRKTLNNCSLILEVIIILSEVKAHVREACFDAPLASRLLTDGWVLVVSPYQVLRAQIDTD